MMAPLFKKNSVLLVLMLLGFFAKAQMPTASFNINTAQTICSGDTVTFTNTSTNLVAPTLYVWSFDATSVGGANIVGSTGSSSSLVGPHQVVYTNSGTTPLVFAVGLLVSNGAVPAIGVNADTQSYYIVVMPSPPTPIVSFKNAIGCTGKLDTLTIANPVAGYTYNVSLSNGATVLSQASATGPYVIQLPNIANVVTATVTTTGLCSRIGTSSINVIACSAPLVSFYILDSSNNIPGTYCIGSGYFATDVSIVGSAPIVSWSWAFDIMNFIPNIYPNAATGPGPVSITSGCFGSGVLYASLTLVDSLGNVGTDTISFTLNPCSGAIPFTAHIGPANSPYITICESDSIYFSDVSCGGITFPTVFNWDFGDGTGIQTGINVSHKYNNPGLYNVTYIAGDPGANMFDTAYQVVKVVGSPIAPAINDTVVCQGVPLNIGGPAAQNISYSWFPASGLNLSSISNPVATPATTTTYYINALDMVNGCSSNDSMVLQIDALPPMNIFPSPVGSVCTNQNVTFNCTASPNVTSYSWTFAGSSYVSGNLNSAGPIVESFTGAGTFPVSVIATTANNCTSTNTVNITAQVCNLPTAAFIVPNDSVCVGVAFNITDASIGSPTNYNWVFGAGAAPSSSTQANPIVTYSTPGPHIITLTVSNSSGSTVFKDTVIAISAPNSPFTMISPVCENVASFVTYSGSASPTATYIWNTAGGTPSNPSGPGPHNISWASSGIKSVTLQVVQNGCYSTITSNNITINANPVTSWNTTINGGTVAFHNTTTNTIGGTTYIWTFGDGANSTLKNPSHTYTADGAYYVCLTVANLACSDQQCDTVRILGITGLQDLTSSNNDFIVQYNKSDKKVKLWWAADNQKQKQISIYNMLGQAIYTSEKFNENMLEINATSFTDNIYIIKNINTQYSSESKKWIKN